MFKKLVKSMTLGCATVLFAAGAHAQVISELVCLEGTRLKPGQTFGADQSSEDFNPEGYNALCSNNRQYVFRINESQSGLELLYVNLDESMVVWSWLLGEAYGGVIVSVQNMDGNIEVLLGNAGGVADTVSLNLSDDDLAEDTIPHPGADLVLRKITAGWRPNMGHCGKVVLLMTV